MFGFNIIEHVLAALGVLVVFYAIAHFGKAALAKVKSFGKVEIGKLDELISDHNKLGERVHALELKVVDDVKKELATIKAKLGL